MPRALAVAALVLAARLPAFAAGFDLHIDNPAGIGEPWPLVAGLPFAPGQVAETSRIRLVDAAGREVPAQIDVAATHRDGSIRWALASFSASPQGGYRVEFGPDVRGAPPTGITTTRGPDGTLTVDTGVRRFHLPPDDLLFSVEGDGAPAEAYLVDNADRRGVCSGAMAQVRTTVLKPGPLRLVVRREGRYVTPEGAHLAGAVAYLSFFAHSPMVKITHTLIFTESTNDLWVRDYGLRFPGPEGADRALFDTDEAFDEAHTSVALAPGETAVMLQDEYPHFARRESHFALSKSGGGLEQELAAGAACGEWCSLASDAAALSVVVPELAKQFPKALSADTGGITVKLWPRECGRELDFRAETLVRDYWQDWAHDAPGGAEALGRVGSDAQGASKTHDVWVLYGGAAPPGRISSAAHALCEPVLALADPPWTCATEAVGWPLHPKDTERFPAEEAMISDFWDRLMLPYRVFPMTGVIARGCHPYLQYHRREGKWFADFYRLSQLVDYGLRRHAWSLYARSGERKYLAYATAFNRFAADWEMAHVTAGQKIKGGFALGDIHKPFYWGTRSLVLDTDISGHDITNWLLDHYITGDERALEVTREYSEAVKAHWDLQAARRGNCPFLLVRLLTALYTREWDEDFIAMARDLAHAVTDLESPNGLTDDMPYGALYKVDRNAAALYDYYRVTGDDLARRAFLKAMDYQVRFNLIPQAIEYQNGGAYLLSIAHEWTGDERYLRAANQLVRSGLVQESVSLTEELAALPPNLDEAESLPYRGVHLNMHPTLGMPTALASLAGAEGPIAPFPLSVKPLTVEPATALVRKAAGRPLALNLYFSTLRRGEVRPQVERLGAGPVAAEVTMEQRMESYAPSEFRRFNCDVQTPAEAPEGLYSIGLGGPEEFVILSADVEQIGLHCPEGFWVGGGGLSAGGATYFNVPAETTELRLFAGRPLRITRPDGTVALAAEEGRAGELALPVQGRPGMWSVQSPYPAHLRLLNVPAVVAFGDPARYPDLTGVQDDLAGSFPPAPEGDTAPFAPGRIGEAVRLLDGRTLSFARGEALPEGGFRHFPGNRGTIEFWFRPNWSSSDIVFADGRLVNRHFVRAGAVNVYYRYGAGPVKPNLYSYVDLLTHGPLGTPGAHTRGHIGTPARAFFRRGQWYHFAATWDITQGQRGTEGDFRIYLDGHRVQRVWDYPRVLSGREPYALEDIAERVLIGCPEGLLDELRVSDTVRYEGDFVPAGEPFVPDAATRALFHFDGNTDGVSGAEGEPVAAR